MKIKSTLKLYRNGKFIKEVNYSYDPALFSKNDVDIVKTNKKPRYLTQQCSPKRLQHAGSVPTENAGPVPMPPLDNCNRKPVKTPKKKLYTWWERQRTVLRNGSGNRLIKEEWVKRSALIEPRFIAMFNKPWLALDAQIKAEAARGYHAQLNANMSGEYV